MNSPLSDRDLNDADWLRGEAAVGIAFSGGGIRAASFALGVAQSLQARLGLIRGERAARWLSCVSGGSYIAGAITLVNAGSRMRWLHDEDQGAVDLPDLASPYQPGSPELRYMQRHTRYLVEDGAISTYVTFAFAVLAGLITTALVAVGGTAAVLLTFGYFGWALFGVLEFPLAGLVAVVALVLLLVMVAGALGDDGAFHWWRVPVIAALLAACLVTVPAFLNTLEVLLLGSGPEWLDQNSVLLWSTAGGVVLLIVLALLLGRFPRLTSLSAFALAFGGLLLRFVPLLFLVTGGAWLAAFVAQNFTQWVDHLDRLEKSLGDAFWWLFIGGSSVAVTSLLLFFTFPPAHVAYRNRLAKCFAVVRTSDRAKAARRAETIHLSSLAPGPRVPLEEVRRKRRLEATGGQLTYFIGPDDVEIAAARAAAEDAAAEAETTPPWVRFPELLICAAANVGGAGAAPSGGNVLPFVLSATALDMPTEKASLPMDVTEHREAAQVGLTAVMALSGAAVSPAMGRLTRRNYRTILAVLGVRLGIWLPNPLSPSAQAKYKERTYAGASRYGPLAFLGELLGVHRKGMPNVYVTDGGHDENLGLIELLRRGCSEIWAVDASTDPPGRAPVLAQAILSAGAELGCSIAFDLAQFDPDDETGLHRQTFGEGSVIYADGSTAVLRVLKLGLTSTHSSVLHEYVKLDPSFPYHSTLRQIYPATRFDAYRVLGNETANFAMNAAAFRGSGSKGDGPGVGASDGPH